jgi:transketolase
MSALPDIRAVDAHALDRLTREMRGEIISLTHRKKVPHLGSDLSCLDILAVLYWRILRIDPARPDDAGRDRFILSKGHAAKALYTALAFRGFFDRALLETFNEPGGRLPEHPGPRCVPGVEAATGSLGHGLSLGLGMALAGRIARRDYRVYVLLSDGECNEGSVWEAAMMAAAQSVSTLTAIVDFNKWQATGRSAEVLALEPLADKWRAFGWDVQEIDGHDSERLAAALAPTSGSAKPRAFIAHTVKGKGVSFMEDDNNWHYRIPTAEQVEAAFRELGLR